MIRLFNKKERNVTIHCTKQDLQINGVPIEYPIRLNQLEKLFGKPTRRVTDEKYTFQKTYVWDSLGIKVMESVGSISGIQCLYISNQKLKVKPKRAFEGKFFIHDEPFVISEQADDEGYYLHGFWNVSKLQRPDDEHPFGVSIWYDKYFEIPENKYEIKPLEEPEIHFTDFNFKLCILQILMYEKELLQPKFDIYEFIKWYKKRKIDTKEERFEPIPEVMDYLKQLPIPLRLAIEVTEIYQDGGNDIYLNTCLGCEGYEDYWDIVSIKDIQHFPNLKKATLCYAKENVLDQLIQSGIEAKWI